MQKLARRGFSTVNLAFQGLEAKGALYAGTLRAIQEKELKVRTTVGASAGALGSTFAALGVPNHVLNVYMVEHPHIETSDIGKCISIKDRLSSSTRLQLFKKYENQSDIYRYGKDWIRDLVLREVLGKMILLDKLQHLDGVDIADELLLNGSYIAGYGLVKTVENFLHRYLPQSVQGDEKRRNITLGEFKAATGVNLALVGTDLSNGVARVFSATTTPNLPVKYAVRISAGTPFYFPPIYWQSEWGAYLGQSLEGKMFVDGGLLQNLPISLLTGNKDFQRTYLGEEVDVNSVAGFNFSRQGEIKKTSSSDVMTTEQDADLSSIPPDYRKVIKKGINNPSSWDDAADLKEAPGVELTKTLLYPKIKGLEDYVESGTDRSKTLESGKTKADYYGPTHMAVVDDVRQAYGESVDLLNRLKF